MKKLLSILLSAVLCASVIVTNPEAIDLPDVDAGNAPGIEIDFGEGEEAGDGEVEPCDDCFPPPGEGI